MLKEIIIESFQKIISDEGFKYNNLDSGNFYGVIENGNCGIVIYCQRYYKAFELFIVDVKGNKIYPFFNVLEVLQGENSRILDKLYQVNSISANRYLFRESILLNSNFL